MSTTARASLMTSLALGLGLALIVPALGAGCGAAPKRGEELMDSVLTYNDGVRWGRFAAAASRVPPAERPDFVDERDELADDLHISEWDVVKVEQVTEDQARVQIKYSWFLDSVGTVQHTQALQRWQRSGKAWLMVDERRVRGEEMPGLAEPEPESEDQNDADESGGGEVREGEVGEVDTVDVSDARTASANR
ncbi:MAG: hypothetical protein H6709_08305 [Kofleriaceae bacterium]|nr:hypothetical protein [Myxococcales bacterium]MCB9562313.1 hypothetical protein [Kofleriaceae bacterium]MCB9572078.1 hypothetical protein [Kofleriaceae bacterium]